MMEITKLHEMVWVFHDALKNPQSIIDFYENNKTWDAWYTLGTMVDMSIYQTFYHDTWPNEDIWNNVVKPHPDIVTPEEAGHIQSVLDTFYKTTNKYFEELNLKLPSYILEPFNLAKYIEGGKMNYHTDFEPAKAHYPGHKFHTTCLFYLNDNYEGGEIGFAILNDSNTKVIEHFEYKPKKGDVLIFPATAPFYHGVKPITKGEKYIIRSYWQYNQEPDADYNEQEAEQLYDTLTKLIKKGIQLEHNGKMLFFNTYKK